MTENHHRNRIWGKADDLERGGTREDHFISRLSFHSWPRLLQSCGALGDPVVYRIEDECEC